MLQVLTSAKGQERPTPAALQRKELKTALFTGNVIVFLENYVGVGELGSIMLG